MRIIEVSATIGLVLALAAFVVVNLHGCSNPQKAKSVEVQLCKARAEYKQANAALGGALDPKPGSPRAKLEAAEDLLCIDVDAGT